MNLHNAILDELYAFTLSHGMIMGVCSAETLTDLRPLISGRLTPFVTGDIDKRIDIQAFLLGARSVIVTGLSYAKEPNNPNDFSNSKESGIMSQMSVGTDYHNTLTTLLEEATGLIKKHTDFKYRISVDNSPLIERELAVKAGLGFYGKNHMVISQQLGSLFNIGCLVTDLEPPLSKINGNENSACGDCRACIDACPAGALGADQNDYDYKKCISYLTQKKSELTAQEKLLTGRHIYGCDICQNVCPYNKSIPRETVPHNMLYPPLKNLLELTDDDFQTHYASTAAGWRGAALLQRNAKNALDNITNVVNASIS